METRTDCLPCFLRQTLIALDQVFADESVRRCVLSELFPVISATDFSQSPAFTTSILHRKIRQRLGTDPYGELKSKYNHIALDLFPSLKKRVEAASDPLWSAARLAIAGNIIDFGIFRQIDLQDALNRAVTSDLAIDHYAEFDARCRSARKVLYLLDNAGEIVFDRLLIEVLLARGLEVIAVAKGGPVINDATMSDAVETGLASIIPVMTNGSDDVGTWLPGCSDEFREELDRAEMVISKGQANFETLYLERPDAFFLFQAKCDVLARFLQVDKGAMILGTDWPHTATRD